MATSDVLIAQVSQELLEELTAGGTRDLTQLTLSQMEHEVYQLADRLSERLLRGMLEDQAGRTDTPTCPCCHEPLEERPPDETSVRMQRCQVSWRKPVKRCHKCRRDFFPSGQTAGLRGGGDV
jgi:uncharacterized protein with PIN domain